MESNKNNENAIQLKKRENRIQIESNKNNENGIL